MWRAKSSSVHGDSEIEERSFGPEGGCPANHKKIENLQNRPIHGSEEGEVKMSISNSEPPFELQGRITSMPRATSHWRGPHICIRLSRSHRTPLVCVNNWSEPLITPVTRAWVQHLEAITRPVIISPSVIL
ncbi:hypothetical protein TNCV_4347061 [Trichonephila clavipes]|nr:hypothetical protein TNCV_4347061 [Trichonephila clavipes]